MAMFAGGYFPNMVYEKKDWELKSFNVDRGVAVAREKTASALDAVDPNLAPFRSRGGKLILFHGWNDPAIPALNTVNYYENVLGEARPERHRFLRSPVHGSRHAALRGRARRGCVRHIGNLAFRSAAQRADCAGNVGGEGNGAGGDHRFENSEYGSAQRVSR